MIKVQSPFIWLNIADAGSVRTEFYRLIEIGVGERAKDLVDAFLDKAAEDGIMDILETRLHGVVSDGKISSLPEPINILF